MSEENNIPMKAYKCPNDQTIWKTNHPTPCPTCGLDASHCPEVDPATVPDNAAPSGVGQAPSSQQSPLPGSETPSAPASDNGPLPGSDATPVTGDTTPPSGDNVPATE